MNKSVARIMLLFGWFILFTPPGIFAQPSKETLLKAWEDLQKNDPNTIVFEKIADKQYRFKTEIFPFDGELKVLNLVIDDRYYEKSPENYSPIRGIIEVELVGLSKDFLEKHSYSYSIWAEKNTLCYDKKTNKWLPQQEYNREWRERVTRNPFQYFLGILSVGLPPLVFILFLIVVVVGIHKLQKGNMDYIQKSITLGAENNKLLKEMIEILKSKNI